MAKDDTGDDSVRRIGTASEKPWRANRSAREGLSPQRPAATATATANDQKPPVRRIRTQEGPSLVIGADAPANELGFHDTTVIADDVPQAERPKSHKRKVVSQEEPKPTPILPPNPNLANMLLGLAQGMFTAAWGPEAAFTPAEHRMIAEPLGRIMARMDPGDAARFAAFSDPVFLATGLLIWGMRVWTLQQRASTPRQTPPSRPSGPVVQGMSMDEVTLHHEPTGTNGTNGAANVAPHIAAEWGGL